MKNLLRILMAAGMILFSPALHADNYPQQADHHHRSFGPGSASDTITRVVGQPLGIALNQSVIVEPRPGANGALAALYVARAAAGRLHAVHDHQLAAFGGAVPDEECRLRSGQGLRCRCRGSAAITLMLCVHPSIPAKSVKELIDYAKANPGKLTFASANTSGIVAGETLKHWAKLDMLHVPYKSTPPALNDLLAGRVSMMFVDFTTGLPHVKAGTLRALAVTRHQAQLAVPRAADHGRGRRHRLRHGRLGRRFAPPPTRRQRSSRVLNTELRKIIDSPEIKTKLGQRRIRGVLELAAGA